MLPVEEDGEAAFAVSAASVASAGTVLMKSNEDPDMAD
jgi:hypothetical protein